MDKPNCSCGGTRLVYACSGACDVGEITDVVARKLRDDNFAKMSCLAGVGAGVEALVAASTGACGTLAIDGCTVGCAKTVLEGVGLEPVSVVLEDMGYEKGNSPLTEEIVEEITEKIKSLAKPE